MNFFISQRPRSINFNLIQPLSIETYFINRRFNRVITLRETIFFSYYNYIFLTQVSQAQLAVNKLTIKQVNKSF